MEQKAIIIAGTAGIGKSTLAKLYKNVIDLESSDFKNIFALEQMKLNDEQKKSTGIAINEHYPENYEQVIKGYSTIPGLLLLISNQSFTISRMKKLTDRGIEICLAYPSANLKNFYMKKYEERGNNKAFLERMNATFENHIEEMREIDFVKKHIVLEKETDTLESKILCDPQLITLIKR